MKKLVLLLSFFTCIHAVHAQHLTLQQAIDIALKNSLDIQIVKNNLKADQINNHISIAGGLPEVSGSFTNNQAVTNLNQKLSNGTTTVRNGNVTNALNSGITASFLVFNGYRVHATKNRLDALEKQSEHLVTAQIQNVIAGVMVKYFDIVRQHSYINTIRQSIEVTQKQKEIVDARQSVGLANNADSYQAQLDLTAARQELSNQDLVLQQAKTDLMNLLNLAPDSTFSISDTITIDEQLNFDSIRQQLQTNPELLAAAGQININELLIKEIGAQRYPALSVNGGYNYNRNQNAAGFTLLNQNFGPFVGLSLQVPIFNGGIFKRQQRIATIDVDNARLTNQNLYNDFLASAVRSWQAYQNILQRIIIERENNRIAAALLDLTLKRYELLAATIVEVREAQRSFVEAGYRLINLAYTAKLAEIELKRLSAQL